MAASKEVIELLFNAEYAGKAEVRALKRDLNDLSGDLQSGISTISAYTVALGRIEAAAIATAIGLASAGAEAAGNFNAGFAEISTLVTATDEDLGAFKQSIQDYAATSTASFSDINGALYNAISAGVDYKDSIDFLRQAEQLSVAGKTDLNSAVQVLTGTLSAYGEETDQAGQYSDVLFSTVRNGVTTVPELVSSLGGITGTAAALGVSFGEISASVATLTKFGIATNEAITALKAAISNIIKPSEQAKEAADELGISLGTSALESGGFARVMEEIAIKTGGSKEEISKLFGSTEALNVVLALTSENGLASFKSNLESVTDSAGATETAFTKMADNVNLIKQTLSNSIEGTLIAIGEPILDEFKDIDTAVTSIFNTIRDNVTAQNGALVPVVDSVENLAGTVADIIRNMSSNMDEALNTADLSGFSGAFDQLSQALSGLDLATPEGLANAISGIGDAFESLTSFTVVASELLVAMFEVFSDIGGYITSLDEDTLAYAGTLGGLAIVIGTASAVLSPFIGLLLKMKNLGGIPGAIGSAAKIAKAGTAVGGLTSNLGKMGVAGAAIAGGFFAGGEAVEYLDEKTGFLTGSIEENIIAGEELTKGFERWKEETGNATATMGDYAAALEAKVKGDEEATKSGNDLSESLKIETKPLWDTLDASEKIRSVLAGLTYQYDENGRLTEQHFQAMAALSGEQNALYEVVEQSIKTGVVPAYEDLQRAGEDAGDGMTKAGEGARESVGEVEALKGASEALKSQVDSMEGMELAFDLQAEKVRADAEEISSIMDSLGETTSSTGESISSSFNIFGDLLEGLQSGDLDFTDKWKIQDQTDELIEIQKKATDAQAEISRAKAEYLRQMTAKGQSGDALISIDGTNLAPELEAFMFRILKAVQLRVSGEYADFLVGVPD